MAQRIKPMHAMRDEVACFAKAAEMEAQAERCRSPGQIADFLDMARCWRVMARQAAWQDAAGIAASGAI